MRQVPFDEVKRAGKKEQQASMFESDWSESDYWWGMPSFAPNESLPAKKLVVNFQTVDEFVEFAKVIGYDKLNPGTDSVWYPRQEKLTPGLYYFDGPKVDTRYPVCLPSKGRADVQKTGVYLEKMGVNFRFFVEEAEYPEYVKHHGEARVVSMPFNNLGLGSVPARNFIWDWAKENGHARHWVMDDNIAGFVRFCNGRRIRCRSGMILRAMEDFVDRYENIAMAGPHNQGFVPDRQPSLTPVFWNNRVYSCILLDTSVPFRWRGKFNEDTDLSIRLMKEGYCTALFRAFMMNKMATAYAKGKAMKGGNTDNVYVGGDHRLAFAQSLKEQHPDIVDVIWRFNRWHHVVDYSGFAGNKPKLKESVTRTIGVNEYQMALYRGEEEPLEEEVQAVSGEDGTTEYEGQPDTEGAL